MSCQLFPNQWIFNVQSYKLIPIESFTNNKVQNVNLKWEIQGSYIHFIANKDMKLSNGYKNKTNERSNKSRMCPLLLMWLAAGWWLTAPTQLLSASFKRLQLFQSPVTGLFCLHHLWGDNDWRPAASSRPPLAGTMSGGQIETDCTPRQQASVTISTHLLNSITDRHRLELQTKVHPKVSNQGDGEGCY